MSLTNHKERVRDFYDTVSPYFRDLWGEHLHDGYYAEGDETKEVAQDKLVAYLADRAGIEAGTSGLDVGCGMGATSVWLARERECRMTGVTLSPVQVEVARKLAERERVDARFEVADAETLEFEPGFDFLWMVGVLGHLEDQRAFVERSPRLLRQGGRFLVGDWMSAANLGDRDRKKYVDPVLDGMLMPDIASLEETAGWFESAGYRVLVAEDIAETTGRRGTRAWSSPRSRALPHRARPGSRRRRRAPRHPRHAHGDGAGADRLRSRGRREAATGLRAWRG